MFSPPASTDDTSFPILINQEMNQRARHFAGQQPSEHHALRVYRNTLAVSVVNSYLQMLGIKTDLTIGDSWNPVLRLTNDVADLVTPQGRLECRPVDKTAENCYVPLEVQCDRLAYIVVRLDSPQEASILGFVGQGEYLQDSQNQDSPFESEYLPLTVLRPPSELPHYLSQVTTVVYLRQWLEGIYQQNWQAPETLLRPQQLALSNLQATVQRAKLIQLNLYSEHSDAVLLLALSMPESAAISTDTINVKAQLYPAITKQETVSGLRFVQASVDCLLPDITLSIHSAENNLSRDVVSRAYPRDNCIQIPQFQGELGEQFTLIITAGDQHIEEQFQL